MTMKHTLARGALALGTAIAVMGAASPASAQEGDPRWLPWIGCWAPANPTPGLDLVCVRPAEQAGAIEMLRISDNTVSAREVLWADGQRHDTSRESCTGWDMGTFSEDGRRLFLKGEYTCEGVTQETAGIIAMASPVAWVDIRVAGMAGEDVAWVQRFHAAPATDVEAAGFGDILEDQGWSVATARLVASADLDVDDVIEASAMVPAEAVQALLAEKGDKFELTAADLLRMADAGVSDDVIDVTVAVSYPERFRLNTGQEEQVAVSALDTGSLRRRPIYGAVGYYDPFYSPWSLRYGYYGYGYGYGYSPYSYGWGYGGYGYGYGYRPTVVVVDQVERSHGRVVNGRGYSRGRSPASGGGSGGYTWGRSGSSGSAGAASSGAGSRGSSTGRTAKPRGGSSSMSSSSGGTSGGAASSSSGGTSTGRTAKPRGSGGF